MDRERKERATNLVLLCGEDTWQNRVWLVKGDVYIDLTLGVCRMVAGKHTVRWDVQGNEGVTVESLPESDPGVLIGFPGGQEVYIRLLEVRGVTSARFSFQAPPDVSIWRHKIAVQDDLIPAHILNS